MTMYWIYDLPIWLFGIITVVFFVAIAVGGLVLAHGYIKNNFGASDAMNGAVGGYIGGMAGLYGLLLGLIIVASMQNFGNASTLTTREAAATGALYVDISSYPEPHRSAMRETLKTYVNFVVNEEWRAQQRGQLIHGGRKILLDLQQILLALEPGDSRQRTIQAEAFQAFNKLIDARRMRLDTVDDGLPAVLWIVVISGSILSIAVSYFLHFSHFRSHLLLTAVMAAFIALLVFLAAAVDNPFRGGLSVSPGAYRSLLETWASDQISAPVPMP